MKVMIIGNGGREHAIAWKLKQSPLVSDMICVPGNAGISDIAECIQHDILDCNGLAAIAKKKKVDLTIVGPEAPLSYGIVDIFQNEGLVIFGPTKEAATIESSKSFAKALMKENGIPTPEFEVFTSHGPALDYARRRGFPVVVKADGLAAGKGVIICRDLKEAQRTIQKIMIEKVFGKAGTKVIIEDYIKGEEVSFLTFTNGKTVLPMATSQDHKPVYDNDEGPNTGGMGAYSPAPIVTSKLYEKIMDCIMIPAVKGMAKKGIIYKGVLYAGIIIRDGEPFVLEFNCRFGDPEIQPILMLMKSDLMPVIKAVIKGRLSRINISWHDKASVCIIAASSGYPGIYEKEKEIHGLERISTLKDVAVFHAGTKKEKGKILTNGGRVFGITALGSNLKEAVNKAYKVIEQIEFEGIYYRKDIGKKGLRRLNI